MDTASLTLKTKSGWRVNARPDTLDFRDKMFEPTLVEVPTNISLKSYRNKSIPILNQGKEGACTGFGLATVVNYLLRTRKIVRDIKPVSPWMLYLMAKRYDEWPGERYDGSSARGAMKGWHKHGVCADTLFRKNDAEITPGAAKEATKRPLGAYYRVNHKDLVAMHSAIAEVGVLYATASVHEGWDEVKSDGIIRFSKNMLGGHAFAIVAYDAEGFWLQNSWTDRWGKSGFGHISYDDWLANGTDVWVARLGAPVSLKSPDAAASRYAGTISKADALGNFELRRHIISIGNNGMLSPGGTYGTTDGDVRNIFEEYLPKTTKKWKRKRILLYAHGGLVDESSAVQRLIDYRPAMLAAEVYPLFFIWHTDLWSTLTNILNDAVRQRRPEGILDRAKDFMLDRLDDVLEPLSRSLGGKSLWTEMKENAEFASKPKGGSEITAQYLKQLVKNDPAVEIHLVGHSAGSIFHGALLKLLARTDYDVPVSSCTLWAPACTTRLFKDAYLPAIKNRTIREFCLFTLTDKAEQDDNCLSIYNKSLLYLVSHAFEEQQRIPYFRDGEPLLGMEKYIRVDNAVKAIFENGTADWILAPNAEQDPRRMSTARHHGDFDNDEPTVRATLARILGEKKRMEKMKFSPSATSLRERRLKL